MADRELIYKISTPADTTGAQATQAALGAITEQANKLAGSAAQAGVETGRFVEAAGRLREANGRFVETGNSAQQAAGHIDAATQSVDHLLASLKAGVGIDLGHRLVEGLAEVPAKIREMIEAGVQWNAQMETMKIGLAGAFRAAAPDTYTSFQAAKAAGEDALEAIRTKALDLGLDFHALVEGLTINLKGLKEGGVTDIQQQIDLIATLNQAAQAKGLQGFQASRDIIDLLNGRANRTLFGAELGIKDEDVKMAREAGKLYEFLNTKLAAYKEGGQQAANTFAAAEQRLKTETEALYGEISKPVFEALKIALTEINTLLKDGQVADDMRALGYDIAELAKDGATLLRWGIEMAPILFRVAEGVGAVSLGIALLKLPGLVATLGQKSLAWLESAKAIDAETAALQRNAAAAGEDALAKNALPGTGAGAGASGRGFLSTAGAGSAIGVGLVALEAGYGLIKLYESAANEQIDAIERRATAETRAIEALGEQVDLAKTAVEQDKARAAIKKEIADLDAKIAASKTSGYVADGAGGGSYYDTDPNGTMLDEQRRLSAQHQLDTFDSHAGKELAKKRAEAAKAKQDKEAFDKYQQTDEYQLGEAENQGNQQGIDDRQYDINVAKRKKALMEHGQLGEEDAEREAQRLETGADEKKQRKGLDAEVERNLAQIEKQKSAASIREDLESKMREISGGLPSGTGSDLGSLGTAVKGLPEGTQEEIDQKTKLADLLKEIIALRKDEAAAQQRENTQKDKDDRDAKKTADAIKETQDAIADEKEQTAILAARGRGEKDVADKLEKQRDIRVEIERLQKAGVNYADAQALAEAKITAQNDAQDQKDAGRASRHQKGGKSAEQEYDEKHHTFTVHGYSDPDASIRDTAGGGLHTGGLSTGSLGSTGGSSAADALANAPSYVPSFPGGSPLRSPLPSLLPTGYALAQALGVQTALSALAPVGSGVLPSAGSAGAGVNPAGAGGSDAVTSAAQRAAETTSRTADSASKAAEALGRLTEVLGRLERELANVKRTAETALSRSENRA